ncbi:MAG: hypothetical protein M3Y56_04595, partial [Armatimonadota bacterium]|nr:hypothetical protein [Armatimonadota bacterium]
TPSNSGTDNPTPIFWDPGSMSSVSLSAPITAAYVSQCPVTLKIYSSTQGLVKTLTQTVTLGGLDTQPGPPATSSVHSATVAFTWDGSMDNSYYGPPPAPQAPKGIYLYQFQVSSNGFPWDYDQDQSSLLTISQAVSNATGYDATAHLNSYTDSCVLTEGVVPLPLATAAHVSVYDPDLNEITEPSTGPPSGLFGGPSLTGLEINPVGGFTLDQNQYGRLLWDEASYQISIPPPLQPNDYTRLFSAEDNNIAQNKGHLLRWALQRTAQPNPPTIEAASTADTAVSGTPHYFSGTNCRVVGHAKNGPGSGPGTYIISAELIIVDGGTDVTVSQWTYDPSLPQQQRVDVSANFDSTHFGDEASITIKLRVTDNLGNICQSLLTAPARNKAYVLTNCRQFFIFHDFVRGEIASELEAMNHTCDTSSTDTATTITGNIPNDTVFYISTHGNVAGFADCNYSSFENAAGESVQFTDVANAIANKTADQPPYNFAFIDACDAGANSSGLNDFGISGADRAFIGWPFPMAGTLSIPFTISLFDHLKSGDTLYDSMCAAWIDFVPFGPVSDGFNLLTLILYPVVPSIMGDENMKLHGVYGGTDADQWYKP